MNVYPLHHGVSFYPSLLNFCLQITYRKLRNLQIGVDKFIILGSAKPAAYIIIDVPTVAWHVV